MVLRRQAECERSWRVSLYWQCDLELRQNLHALVYFALHAEHDCKEERVRAIAEPSGIFYELWMLT
jgi:hypothetical protein